ncbi:hypothetical protein AHiyo8_54800 [Arthrobacter sp. Hiyo8]|nr:hypothetical protein AHiyo8_54800 [Arthrobacter sp. Hiyo8]
MSTPIYELALGAKFRQLQPELQDYFSLAPGSGSYGIGEGVFDVVGCRQKWLRPLLATVAGEEAFFPEYGERIPFRIENHAHLDPFGRSSLTARREIFFPGHTRLFHDTTVAEAAHDGGTRLVDYLADTAGWPRRWTWMSPRKGVFAVSRVHHACSWVR